MRTPVRAAASGAVGVLLLAALVWWAGPDRVLEAARRADARLVVGALVCYATFFALRGWRWAMLLRPNAPRVDAWGASHATSIGWLANNVLPMRAGEVVRAGVMSKRTGAPFFAVASTIAVERVLDVAGLALAAALALLLVPGAHLPAWAGVALRLAAILPLVGLALLAAAVLARERIFGILGRLLAPAPERLRAKVLAVLGHLADGAEPVVRRPRLLGASLALTLAMTVAQAGIYAFLVRAFLPEIPVAVALAGAPWFILTFAIAFTPGNVGTYEAAFTAVYSALGVAPEAALAAAVLTHIATFLSVVVLGSLSIAVLGAGAGVLRTGRPRPEV